jgi:hypothetical protein
MSAGGSRRRRRRSRSGSSLAGDPLDLFLDAITNALGVIMFILLMVVLFGRADEAPSPSKAIAEAKRMQEEVDRLAQEAGSLPPAGDPEMERRLKEAIERTAAAERVTATVRPEAERVAREAAEAVARAEESRRELERLAARLEVLAKAIRPPGGFIRLSRLDTADRRPAEYLAIASGRLSKLAVTAETAEIRAPADGIQVRDAAGAAAAVKALLEGVDPKARRVELVAWQGSFREAKLVEQALIDAGFGINAIPVEAGKALGGGKSGVQ